jgi:hypothetical protein
MTNYPTLLGTGGHQSGANFSTTNYYSTVCLGRNGLIASFPTESFVSQTVRVAGTISYLSWGVTDVGSIGEALDLYLRVNSSNSTLTVHIPAETAGWVTDSTHSVTVASGDKLDFGTVLSRGDTSGAQFEVNCVSARFDASVTGTVPSAQLIGSQGLSTLNESTTLQPTCFLGIVFDGTASESTQQIYTLAAGTWQNMACNIQNNDLSLSANSILVHNRIGGSNGSMHVSYVSAQTGLMEDASDSDDISVGDLVNYGFHCALSGSGTFDVEWIGAHFLATNANLCMIGGSPGSSPTAVIAPSSDPYFTSLFGGGEVGSSPGRATGLFPYALTASNYTNHLSGPPSGDGVATFTLLKNYTTAALSVSSTAQTGYFIDTDTASFDAGDFCSNQISVAETGGSVTWSSAALLLEAD